MGPALALLELSSIARGHRVADAMLKRAPVRLMRADAISPGKFLVLVAGDVAAVDESFRVGADVAGDRAIATLFLPQPHTALWPALAGEASAAAGVESLGVVETTTVVATVAVSSFVGTSVYALSGLVLGDAVASSGDLVRVILVALLWDVLLTPLVLPGVMRLLARMEPAGAR